MDFRVFLCGYGMKIPAGEFYLDVLRVANIDMAGALAYYKINLMLQWCILCGFTATPTLLIDKYIYIQINLFISFVCVNQYHTFIHLRFFVDVNKPLCTPWLLQPR